MGLRKRSEETIAEELGEADSFVAESSTASRVSPLDIQQKEFGVSRFGGYKMRDVDVFLDELTDALSALMAENERLRASGPDGSDVSGPDAAEIRRQADEQLAQARSEADRILAEARERSTASLAASAAGGEGRAAVDAFLAQERAFLQGLGRLVQQHTESVKQMARSARQRPEPPTPARAPAPAPRAESAVERPAPRQTESDAAAPPADPRPAAMPRPSIPERVDPAPARPAEPPQRTPQPTEPIRIEEAEPVSARRRQPEDPPAPGSLKELFWGEDA